MRPHKGGPVDITGEWLLDAKQTQKRAQAPRTFAEKISLLSELQVLCSTGVVWCCYSVAFGVFALIFAKDWLPWQVWQDELTENLPQLGILNAQGNVLPISPLGIVGILRRKSFGRDLTCHRVKEVCPFLHHFGAWLCWESDGSLSWAYGLGRQDAMALREGNIEIEWNR